MDIGGPPPRGGQLIRAYGDGGFRIAETRWEGGVLVLPDRTFPWPVGRIAELSAPSLEAVRLAVPGIELLLLGCGRSMQPVPPAVRQEVRRWGVVIEPMDTGAACRTYNVLLLENRRVAAALLPID